MNPEYNTSNTVFVITGPTAAGKSRMSYHIQKHLGCQIVSADSRQIYREMSIGTAKPSKEEIDKHRIRLCDYVSIKDFYTAADFVDDGLPVLEEDFAKHGYSVICGGTGMYIRALSYGLDDFPRLDKEIKGKWDFLAEERGLAYLQEKLKIKDPEYSEYVDLNNHRRLVRALALIDQTGQKFSSFLSGEEKDKNFKTVNIVLELPRAELYKRIEERVDRMMERGLLQEVEALLPYRNLKALDTVGYKELFKYLDAQWTYEEAVERIKIHTRQYAKRQMTWLKKYNVGKRFHPLDISGVQSYVENFLK